MTEARMELMPMWTGMNLVSILWKLIICMWWEIHIWWTKSLWGHQIEPILWSAKLWAGSPNQINVLYLFLLLINAWFLLLHGIRVYWRDSRLTGKKWVMVLCSSGRRKMLFECREVLKECAWYHHQCNNLFMLLSRQY